jgi:hypothetical protein
MAARFRAQQQEREVELQSEWDNMRDDDIQETMYPDDDDDDDPDQSETEDDCIWVNLAPEVANPIDTAIQSRIEQHRREAAQFNATSVIRALHPTYMALKNRTKNWTGPDADKSFVNCRCLPSDLTHRMVDLIDIMSQ